MQKFLSVHMKSLTEIVGYDDNGDPLDEEEEEVKRPAKKAKKEKDSGKGGGKEAGEKKKTKRKPSSSKSGEGGGGGGYMAMLNLSPELRDVLKVDQLARPHVVKELWVYIKGNNLQNPSNKREIMCDALLKKVFKTDKIDMFAVKK